MKVLCPSCGQLVLAENVSLDSGWGKCTACNDVFPLAKLLDGYAAPGAAAAPVERPFDAWAVVTREPDRLMVHIPAEGMRAGTWGMLGFATFWTGFIAFWTFGALGALNGQIQWENIVFAAFSIPFWLVGFGMLAAVLWASRGTRTLYLDSSQVMTELHCLIWRKRRLLERAQVQHARVADVQRQSDNDSATPRPAVEVVFEKGSFRIPCNSRAEQAWLLAEINGFLQQTPVGPAPSSSAPLGWAGAH